MEKPTGDDAYTWWFVFTNRTAWFLLHFFGPAQGSSSADPQERRQIEYKRRKALHEEWKASRAKS